MSEDAKVYLGDSVYCQRDRGMVCLTTDNGLGPSNRIFLEDSVIAALLNFLEREWNVEITVKQLKEDSPLDPGYGSRAGEVPE